MKATPQTHQQSSMDRQARTHARDVLFVCKRKVVYAFGICVITLHLLNIPVMWFRLLEERSTFQNVYVLFFSVGEEGKVPTWYSACAVLFCAMLLALIAIDTRKRSDRSSWYWAGLALVFTYLSLDEASAIHEMANTPVANVIAPIGALAFGWVVPASICVVIMALLYWRFLFRLPERTRRLFVTSGAIYLSGALGMEMFSAYHWYGHGRDLGYLLITSAEEFLEMSGIVLFIYALLDHLDMHTRVSVKF